MPKSRLSADDRREQIIEKAAEVFSIKGVIGTRTRDVAEACGINEALIYSHFESKEELYREAMLRAYRQIIELWEVKENGQTDSLTALLDVLERQFQTFADNPILCANLWHGVAASIHDPILREHGRREFEKYHEFLRSFLRLGIEDGSIRPDFDVCEGMWMLRGVGLTFILRNIIDMSVQDGRGTPELFCKFIHSIMSPVREDPPAIG